MLVMNNNANKIDYSKIFSNREATIKLLRVLRWHKTGTKAKLEKAKQEAISLLEKHNYSSEEIDELLTITGFNKSKVVNLPVKDKHAEQRKQVEKHVSFLHEHEHLRSWVCLAHIDGSIREDGWVQYHYWNDKVVEEAEKILPKNTSTYVSVNQFRAPMRNALSVRYMTSFYVDIDAHGEEKVDLKAIKRFLNRKYKEGKLPKHSRLTATGRGVQVYWKLELVPDVLYWMWRNIAGYIAEELSDIKDHVKGHEVDASCSTDVTRVFRVEGTRNPKSNTIAYCVETNKNVYRMSDILIQYFGDKVKIAKTKAEDGELADENGNKITLNNAPKQHFQITRQRRLHDLRVLLELRKNHIMKGHREFFLFVYSWTFIDVLVTEKMLYDELSSVNEMFADSLTDKEVTAIARKVFKKWGSGKLKETAEEGSLSKLTGRYCYTNKTIIERLDISEFERSHFETIFWDKAEAKVVWDKRRNEKKKKARRTGKKQQNKREKSADNTRRKVKYYKAKGLTQEEVAKKIGKTTRTVKNYWN